VAGHGSGGGAVGKRDVDQVEDVFVAGVDTGADVGQPGHVAGVGVVVAEEFVADTSGARVAGLGGSDAFL